MRHDSLSADLKQISKFSRRDEVTDSGLLKERHGPMPRGAALRLAGYDLPEKLIEILWMRDIALPDHQWTPPLATEFLMDPSVSRNVCRKLGLPELTSRGGCRREQATRMPMPEATVDEYHAFELRQDEVRTASQRPVVELESQSRPMQVAANRQLRSSISASDTLHHEGSLLGRDDVDHKDPHSPRGAQAARLAPQTFQGLVHPQRRKIGEIDCVLDGHNAWRG